MQRHFGLMRSDLAATPWLLEKTSQYITRLAFEVASRGWYNPTAASRRERVPGLGRGSRVGAEWAGGPIGRTAHDRTPGGGRSPAATVPALRRKSLMHAPVPAVGPTIQPPPAAPDDPILLAIARGKGPAACRARVIGLVRAGMPLDWVAAHAGVAPGVVTGWVDRYDREGPAAITLNRAGRARSVVTRAVWEAVVRAAARPPRESGQRFGVWTLNRLTAYIWRQYGAYVAPPRIGEILSYAGVNRRRLPFWYRSTRGADWHTALAAQEDRLRRDAGRRRPRATGHGSTD